MPVTRKSSRLSSGSGKQSTLSFNHRVTKNVRKPGKESAVSPPAAKEQSPPPQKAAPVEPEPEEELGDTSIEQGEEIAEKPHATTAAEPVPEKTEAELKAEKVSRAAIERYWKALEDQRIAKRVHQEDLSTNEKVLRYFDVSSQYGPCIGIPRVKRWQRAERLGLNPPIEVLAVLIQESSQGGQDIQRAHMDDIMNSTAVGAA